MPSYDKQCPESIQEMFGSIAENYDQANTILSMRLNKRWNSQLLDHVTAVCEPEVLLDLCCGTGDIAFNYLKNSSLSRQAILLDFCQEMLECAKKKASTMNFDHHAITYIQADAQKIPLENSSISCATMAYGIRNIKHPHECLSEIYRVLSDKGTFGLLELTRPPNPFFRLGHYVYLKTMIPFLGRWITSNRKAYEYLCQSINTFYAPDVLEDMLKKAGFQNIIKKPVTFGVATIFVARK